MLLGTVSLVIEDTPDSQRMQAMLVDGPHIFYANYSPTGCCYLITKQRIKLNVVSQQKKSSRFDHATRTMRELKR